MSWFLPDKENKATWALILLWWLIFLLDNIFFSGASTPAQWLYGFLFQSRGGLNTALSLIPGHFFAGDYWQLLTYPFTHTGLFHVAGNTLLIVLIGNILEPRLHALPMLGTMLAANTLLGLVCLAFFPPDSYQSGASIGIYALYGLLLSMALTGRQPVEEYMSKRVRNRIAVILILCNLIGWGALIGHGTGFAVGMLCGILPGRKLRKKAPGKTDS